MDFVADLIIPAHNAEGADFPYRKVNLKSIVENTPKDVHIVVVEQVRKDEVPLISDAVEESENLTKVVKNYSGAFCKGWLYNVGVRHSKTEHIVLGECDCWSEDPEYWKDLVSWVIEKKLKWAFAWNSLTKHRRNRDPITLRPKRGGSEGGHVYFNKKFYWSIGGHNEGGMKDLGAVDCEIIRRAEAVAPGYPKFPRTIIHGVHSWSRLKGKSRSTPVTKNYKMNKRIYSKVCSNPRGEAKRLGSLADKLGRDKPLFETMKIYKFVR